MRKLTVEEIVSSTKKNAKIKSKEMSNPLVILLECCYSRKKPF